MIGLLHEAFCRLAGRCMLLARSRKGNLSLELALITPVIFAMIAGAVEFGRLGMEHVRLANAARAGTQYGIQDLSSAGDIDGIIAAVRQDAEDVSESLTVAAAETCRCSGGAAVPCENLCADGEYAPRYVEVSVSEEVGLWFTFPGVPSSITVAAGSSMRIR